MSAAVMLMKDVIRSEYGDADVFRIARLKRPVRHKIEVLTRVKATGLDRGQWHLMPEKPFAMRFATGAGRSDAPTTVRRRGHHLGGPGKSLAGSFGAM